MNKLKELIKELPIKDLQLIRKDVESGNLERVLEKSIRTKQANRIVLCPVCSSPVKEGEGYHLQWGKPDMRKKATFDGKDCLRYFMEKH